MIRSLYFYSRLQTPHHVLRRLYERALSHCFSSSIIGRFALYKRISPLGDPKISVLPVLDEWVREGKPVTKQQLQQIIKELTKYRRFKHALEISQWMSDRMYYPPSRGDFASRLNLILRVHGLHEAEEFFNSIAKGLKGIEVYTALLNCYAHEWSAEKAEELMQTMRDMGITRGPLCYNIMMNMYYQMNMHEKLDVLILEMKQNRIPCDQYSLSIQLSAYAAASNIEGIEKTIERIESNPKMAMKWDAYAVAANGYLKVELIDKAIVMLKKCEELINERSKNEAFDMLLKLYAETGRKEELCRIWYRYKAERKVYNRGYMSMISSVLKLDDIELAEAIFTQWESLKLSYDFRVPKLLVDSYCKNGLLEKAESLLQHTEVKGVDPSVDAYYCLASGYVENNEISKATGVIEKAISVCTLEQRPEKEILSVCLKYLGGKGDVKGVDDFMSLLRSKNVFSAAALERLNKYIYSKVEKGQTLPHN